MYKDNILLSGEIDTGCRNLKLTIGGKQVSKFVHTWLKTIFASRVSEGYKGLNKLDFIDF